MSKVTSGRLVSEYLLYAFASQVYVSIGQFFHYEPLGKVGTLTNSRWRLVKGEPLRVVDISKV